jgi:hypothetical protein
MTSLVPAGCTLQIWKDNHHKLPGWVAVLSLQGFHMLADWNQ